jgi:hypothetical protein
MGRRVRSWATLIVAAALTLLAGLAPATTTTASAATYVYDAQSNARVDDPASGGDGSGSALLIDAPHESVLPPLDARQTPTTPFGTFLATEAGPDFVAGPIGSEPPVPVSQSRMAAGFDEAGFPGTPTASPGTEYTLPDGTKVRLMEPSGQAPMRASFTNANGGPINPFTGKPVQPPAPAGWSMKDWVRALTHVEQTP